MNFIKKRQKGFTLVELLVSIFVFMIIMSIVIEIFGKQVVVARNARVLQRNIEEASKAMNYLAKTLRTSTLPNENNKGEFKPSALAQNSQTKYVQTIYAYDYSQGTCFKFAFEKRNGEGELVMYSNEDVVKNDGEGLLSFKIFACAIDSNYSGKGRKLTRGNVKGGFFISPTIPDKVEEEGEEEVYNESLGKVTISLEIDNRNTEAVKQGEEGTQNMVVVQTSVSLRDYPGDITF